MNEFTCGSRLSERQADRQRPRLRLGKNRWQGQQGPEGPRGRGMRREEQPEILLQRRLPREASIMFWPKLPVIAVNVGTLNKFEDGSVVDTQALIDAGIVEDVLRRC